MTTGDAIQRRLDISQIERSRARIDEVNIYDEQQLVSADGGHIDGTPKTPGYLGQAIVWQKEDGAAGMASHYVDNTQGWGADVRKRRLGVAFGFNNSVNFVQNGALAPAGAKVATMAEIQATTLAAFNSVQEGFPPRCRDSCGSTAIVAAAYRGNKRRARSSR